MHLAQPSHDPSLASALLCSNNCSLNCCRGSCGRKGGGGGKGRTLRKCFLGGGRIPTFPISPEDAESFSLRSPPPPYLQSPGKNWRLRKRFENWFWNRRVGGRAQPLKEWQSPRTWHKPIKNQLDSRWWICWLSVDLEPQYKLVVTHQHGQWRTHGHHDSSKATRKTKSEQWPNFWKSPPFPKIAGIFLVLIQFSSLQWLFATPWTAALWAFLSITNSWGLLKLMSIELVMPSNHLILCCPLSSHLQFFPASGSFPMSRFFASSGQSIWASASASALPMDM